MREQKLIQRRRPQGRRRRPGFFRVERPNQLWHLDMTSIWVAEHGWCYLNAAIDCCTREIVGWSLGLRCRADEAIALVEARRERKASLRATRPRDRQRLCLHGEEVQGDPLRARDRPPPRRLP